MGRALTTLLAVAAAVTLYLANCAGPRPQVGEIRLTEPRAAEGLYRVEATIHNRGPGEGEVSVILRLRDADGRATVQVDRKATLERGETTIVAADIPAPAGRYTPEVEVEYPPR
jgi:hypothetical protein